MLGRATAILRRIPGSLFSKHRDLHRLSKPTSDENALADVVEKLCGNNNNATFSKGVALTGEKGDEAIAALSRRSAIKGVPVDKRKYCEDMLVDSLKRPGVEGRRNLLCSAAFPGSGKSVILWFNCLWFVRRTKGVSVEVTFNADQYTLYNGGARVQTTRELSSALAVRIIHRLLKVLKCDQGDADFACRSGGEVVQVILQLRDPLGAAIHAVRSKLGFARNAKVLLCVDELAKAIPSAEHPGDLTSVTALKLLTERLDSDNTFYLAISALGTEDIVNLATLSSHLLLQTLGPLWFGDGLPPQSKRLLPPALRPFYDEVIRRQLPWDSDATKVYAELTELLVTAAGHPRRLEVLFAALRRFRPSRAAAAALKAGGDKAAGRAFIKELAAWLHKSDGSQSRERTNLQSVSTEVKGIVRLPTEYGKLIPGPPLEIPNLTDAEISTAIEALALRCAAPFKMPREATEKARLRTVLHGVAAGFCQLAEVDSAVEDSLFLAFVPLPVLDGVRPQLLQPRGRALFALRDAIRQVYDHCAPGQEGKAFEQAAAASMLLLARSRDTFTLSDLCEAGDAGAQLKMVVLGGSGVQEVNKNRWPANQSEGITAKDVQSLIDELSASGAPGMMVTVTSKYNIPADFYGVFKTAAGGYVLLRVQCKNWFQDAVYNKARRCTEDIVTKWRHHDKLAPPSVEVLVNGKTHIVPCVSLLFTANRLEQPIQLGPLEGIITIGTGCPQPHTRCKHSLTSGRYSRGDPGRTQQMKGREQPTTRLSTVLILDSAVVRGSF